MALTSTRKELVHETEWFRVYRIGSDSFVRESKFVTDAVEVTLVSLRERWPQLSEQERLDFTAAFTARPAWTVEDRQILRFLSENGSEDVLVRIAPRLQTPVERERALRLLLERVASKNSGRAKYYQALAQMGDPRAVPVLKHQCDEYRGRLRQAGLPDFEDLADYHMCCHALWSIEGNPECEAALNELLLYPDDRIRRRARLSLTNHPL